MTSPVAAELPDAVRDAFAGRRVAVLGAGGFMGRWVAHWLSRCDADLFLVVRDGAAMKHLFQFDGLERIGEEVFLTKDINAVITWLDDFF